MKITLMTKHSHIEDYNLPKKSVDFLYSLLQWKALPISEQNKPGAEINEEFVKGMRAAVNRSDKYLNNFVHTTRSGDKIVFDRTMRQAFMTVATQSEPDGSHKEIAPKYNIGSIATSLRIKNGSTPEYEAFSRRIENGSTPEYELFRGKRNAAIDERIRILKELQDNVNKRALSVELINRDDSEGIVEQYDRIYARLRNEIKYLENTRPRDFLEVPKKTGFVAFFRNLFKSEASRSMDENNDMYEELNNTYKGDYKAIAKDIEKINPESASLSGQLNQVKQDITTQKRSDAAQLPTPPTNDSAAKPVIMSGATSNPPSKPAIAAVAPTVQSTIDPQRLARYRKAADDAMTQFNKSHKHPLSNLDKVATQALRETFDEFLTNANEESLSKFKNHVSSLTKTIGENKAQEILQGLDDKPQVRPRT